MRFHLPCLGRPSENYDDGSAESGSEAGSEASASIPKGLVSSSAIRSPELTEGMSNQTRTQFKSKFSRAMKAIETKRTDDGKDEYRNISELQFWILAKIFAEEDAFDDLLKLSKAPSAALQILPFILNSLLYGSLTNDTASESSRKGYVASYAQGLYPLGARKKKDKENLSVVENMAPQAYEQKLEDVIFETCKKSVHAALHCAWYFISSLSLGPSDTYHRTMRLLLSMESVVMVNQTANERIIAEALVEKIGPVEAPDPNAVPKKPSQMIGRTVLQVLDDPSETANAEGDDNEAEENHSGIEPVDHHAGQQRGHQRRSTGQLLLKVDTVGDGVGDVALQLGEIGEGEKEDLDKWLHLRKERSNFFHAELDFVKCLTDLSYHLFTVARPQRKSVLRSELEKLNEYIPKHAFIPVLGFRHRVLRIVPEEAFVFSTKERSPYLLTFEIERLPMENELFPAPQTKQSLRRKIKESVPDDVGQVPNQPEETFKYEPDVSIRREGDLDLEEENDDNSDVRTENDDGEHVNPQVIEAFGELFTEKENRLKLVSPHKEIAGWALASCIIKSRDQLRQEMVAMRLISEFYQAFQSAKLKCWIKPYQILATSADSGFIETIKNAQSLSSLRSDPKFTNLRAFFRSNFGGEGSARFKKAVNNFVRSMAGYSVVTYILAIKDRHNGNLMIDSDGHISHIDFGFLLSNSPGGNREFERAPFKLTQDMIDVMGGPKSSHFRKFRKYGRRAYAEGCKQMNKILLEVDMMFSGNESMPCFVGGRKVVLDGIRERMMPNASTQERMQQFDTLVKQSSNNWTTYWYDRYQKCFTGVA
ncbi:hypothetical protein NDN08_004390 [Rhodosorus marinus]|uniref:1-phosphatidylinositol 4-kinase n=1 Tax=Rhodosorus marinus TaxID=101924 RepID=A0AAV8URQ7_9RHOD|nr:hypothetical protein NDN08_004390 [Rhodosorus marinus]